MNDLASAVKLEVDGNFTRALPMLEQPNVRQGVLGSYAQYYQGVAELRLGRPADARQTFQALGARDPVGFLAEAAQMREAESAEGLGDQASALAIYERLAKTKTTAPDDVLMRLGRAAKATGTTEKAIEAFSRVLYEFPFGDLAPIAESELQALPIPPLVAGSNRYKLELGRGERLFGARRYAQARVVFDDLRTAAQGDDRELVQLRLAECDYFQKKARQAREGVRPFIDKASRQGEALFFYAVANRDLGDHDEYLRVVRQLVDEFPTQTWAEEALNNLATHYILQNEDESADQAFRELYEKFPTGRYAERAAWKLGWWAYKNGRPADAARVFESAAAQFPRSDYRPSWLYWSARAHETLNEPAQADARYHLVATDYLNSYYGRLAVKKARRPGADADRRRAAAGASALPPNEPIVRALLTLDLYDQALDELRYAQRTWGDSPAIQATIGWVHNQRGDLRAGINAMKRAYPQYLAAGGEKLPTESAQGALSRSTTGICIRRYSARSRSRPVPHRRADRAGVDLHGRCPVVGERLRADAAAAVDRPPVRAQARHLAALLPEHADDGRSRTSGWAPPTSRIWSSSSAARTTRSPPTTPAPTASSRWIAERPGIDRDEFIDDIPFPETQNYVKRILGTAEDYRRLYGSGAVRADEIDATPAVSRRAGAPPKPSKASASSSKASKKKAPAKKKQPTRPTKKAA